MSKYKHGKQTDAITPADFDKIMEKTAFEQPIIHKAFLALLYYTGARVSEIVELTAKDFKITDDEIHVLIKAKKHGVKRGAYVLRSNLPYFAYIFQAVKKAQARRKHKRVFPFTRQTGWRIVKRVAPQRYPHYFRLNRCVHFLDKPEMTLNMIRQWFGWKSLETVNSYLGEIAETTVKMSDELE